VFSPNESVALAAQTSYGECAFSRWTDRWGRDYRLDAGNPELAVTLSFPAFEPLRPVAS
jgi:hypothetical protein